MSFSRRQLLAASASLIWLAPRPTGRLTPGGGH